MTTKQLTLSRLGLAFVLMPLAVAQAPSYEQQLSMDPKPIVRLLVQDLDRDGYYNFMDCNDDDPLAHPFALEQLDGIDQNCDAVIDDGFDTSIEFPKQGLSRFVWPNDKARRPFDWLDLTAAFPKIVWTGTEFGVVWHDQGQRVRFARMSPAGVLLNDVPIFVTATGRDPDLVWTGSRFGLVYTELKGDQKIVKLAVLDRYGAVSLETVVGIGDMPRLAWGQDRFGIVWRRSQCVGDCLAFQRFDHVLRVVGGVEFLPTSGSNPAIAWSGTGITLSPIEFETYPGHFGIAYEAYYGFAATNDVLLANLNLEPFQPLRADRVNEHSHPVGMISAMPSLVGNSTGFSVVYRENEEDGSLICAKQLDHSGRAAINELMLDRDAAIQARIAWSGSEHVIVQEVIAPTDGRDDHQIHFRRSDGSINSRYTSGCAAWAELNLSRRAGGFRAVHPAVVNAGWGFGVVWVEDTDGDNHGQLRFATVLHR
jgi:hypothetical protein